MPSTSNVSTTGNLDIDGLLSGLKWTSPALTFSFPTALSQYSYSTNLDGTQIAPFGALNAAQMAAARAALNAYSSISGLTFTEVTGGSGTLRFGEQDNAGTAFAYYPYNDSQGRGGDVWLNPVDYNNPQKGTYAWATFLHEIGHALGLDHGQEEDGDIAALPYNHDSLEYSVMTYRSYVGADLNGYTAAQGSFPIGPMLDDIAAIQYMYGANYSTNNTDTTYTWSTTTGAMSINGVNQGGSTTNTIFQTIWDGGGNDTYDFSNYSTNLEIDLSPGNWSTTDDAQLALLGFGGQHARGNIANAYLYQGNTASLIENANGGSGNDTIIGNQANNVLDGKNGNDTLTGGLGNDTLIGGLGTDTCILTVDYADCSFNWDSILEIFTITSLLEGIDSLSGVEWVQFGDGTRSVASMIGPDLTDPTLVSTTPADNAGAVSRSANLVLTFSEAVAAGAGDIIIHYANGDVAMTIAASDTSQVSISGSVVTINPSIDLSVLTDYYVTIDADALHDASDNYYGGISAPDTFNFTTASNIITGNSSANTLNGTEGDDTINGMGGSDKLNGFGGNDTLDGGLGADTMTGGLGNDTYYVNTSTDKVIESAGQGTDSVFSSVSYTLATNVEVLTLTGSSAINGTGNASNNLITGNSANNSLSGLGGTDALFGMGGNDTLNGGAGDDGLSGGLGKDSLTGGTGKDYFYFDTALSAGNVDTITDFKPIDDTIALDNSIFTALAEGALDPSAFGVGSSAANASVHIYYNKSTGGLFYDADGAGGAAGQQIATLTKGLTLTAADFLII